MKPTPYPIQDLFPQATNLTRYAIANGYRGSRPVLVLDGKVISHRSVNWFDFCIAVRRIARRSCRVAPVSAN